MPPPDALEGSRAAPQPTPAGPVTMQELNCTCNMPRLLIGMHHYRLASENFERHRLCRKPNLSVLFISQQCLGILQCNQNRTRRFPQPCQERLPAGIVSQAPTSLKPANAEDLVHVLVYAPVVGDAVGWLLGPHQHVAAGRCQLRRQMAGKRPCLLQPKLLPVLRSRRM